MGARERILDAAYDLFSRHGVRAVGVDSIVSESGVAKMSLYRNLASKDDLAIAFLEDFEGCSRHRHILMKGSIVAAAEGDSDAAARARELGALLLASRT